MKISHITYCAAALLAATALGACDNDGDLIYTSGGIATELQGPRGDIVLDVDHLSGLVLTIFWNDNGDISTNHADVLAPQGANSNIIQIASDEAFTTVVEENVAAGVYERQYTCQELNNLVARIGLQGGVAAPIYVRIKSSVGSNVAPKYSNVLSFNVTPYLIDWTVAVILDSSMAETEMTLYSPNADGVYSGFVGAGAWYNWYLREGDYTIWGNENVGWVPFLLGNSNDGTAGNMWFPGVNGCYWTVVNTTTGEWSALLLPTLTLGGDLSGEMTYNRKANQWSITLPDVAAGTYNVTLTAAGKQYNSATGTDDAAAIDTPVAIVAAGATLAVAADAAPIAVTVAAAGETTLVLDLNDPKQCTFAPGAATVETPVNPLVYLVGIDDGITGGSWTFDNYLRLYSEDNLAYAGAANTNSLWGYQIAIEKDNYSDVYKMTSGDGAAGTLALGEGDNITAPGVGLYFYDVSLKDLTYSTTAVTTVYYTGFNDDWNLYPMTATETPGEYTATVTATAATPWGFEIVLDPDWNIQLGGADGILVKKTSSNIDFAETSGTFLLTVNLCKSTYSIVAQ